MPTLVLCSPAARLLLFAFGLHSKPTTGKEHVLSSSTQPHTNAVLCQTRGHHLRYAGARTRDGKPYTSANVGHSEFFFFGHPKPDAYHDNG